MEENGFETPPATPSVFRGRWRRFVALGIVVVAIIAIIFTPTAVHPLIVIAALIALVALAISGNRPGGGGVDPDRFQTQIPSGGA